MHHRLVKGLVPAAAVLVLVPVGSAALGADLHVPADHPTIQAAIDAAADGDRVLVADGIYDGAGNVDLDVAGKAIVVRSASGPAACILNGQPTPGANAFVVDSGESANTRIEGFTIVGFRTEAGDEGAIRIVGSDPVIFGNVFCDNVTADASDPTPAGSAIALVNSSGQVRACSFAGNIGAPVAVDADSVVYVIECSFAANTARVTGDGGAEHGGGAIESHGFTLVFDSLFVGNTVSAIDGPARGGAIAHFGRTLDLTGDTFIGNRAEGAGGQGAAVYVTGDFVVNGGAFLEHGGDHEDAAFMLDATGLDRDIAPIVAARFERNTVGGLLIEDPDGRVDLRLLGGAFCENVPYDVSGPYRVQGRPSVCCPGDVDGDGAVAFGDLLAVLAAWGECAKCPEDTNDDGVVDFADILTLLSSWGPCPEIG